MQSQRVDEPRRDFALPIVIGDRFSQKPAAIGGAQRLKRIGIEPVAADAGEDGIEKAFGEGQLGHFQ